MDKVISMLNSIMAGCCFLVLCGLFGFGLLLIIAGILVGFGRFPIDCTELECRAVVCFVFTFLGVGFAGVSLFSLYQRWKP